eukprot:scaffold3161_cov118-Isochrysis_galbana.AAC.24
MRGQDGSSRRTQAIDSMWDACRGSVQPGRQRTGHTIVLLSLVLVQNAPRCWVGGGNGGKSQLGRYWEDNFSSRRSSNEKKSTGRSYYAHTYERPVLSSLPFLLALKAQWQVPETGHGMHRRSFRVFDKSAKTSQQTSTLCSSGFLEPRTSKIENMKIYLLAGPLAQKGHWQ